MLLLTYIQTKLAYIQTSRHVGVYVREGEGEGGSGSGGLQAEGRQEDRLGMQVARFSYYKQTAQVL